MKQFDSKEELHFSWFLEQLKKAKYINHWERCETSYQLTGGVKHSYIKPMKKVEDKQMEQSILLGSSYNPDFIVYWEPKALGIFLSILNKSEGKITTPFICDDDQLITIIETKADFDMKNMTRIAINNIKFVYEKYNVYINMVKLPKFFNETFTPDRYLMTDKSFTPRKFKKNFNVRTLREFTDSLRK